MEGFSWYRCTKCECNFKIGNEEGKRIPRCDVCYYKLEPILSARIEETEKKPEQALRFNSDKIEMSVQPYRAWAAFSTVCMLNSEKHGGLYPNNNFYKGAPHSQYLDCAMRHYTQHITGERIDPTDGAPHLWKMLWNVAMAVEDSIVHPENMDINLNNPIDFSLFVDIIKAAKEKRKKE